MMIRRKPPSSPAPARRPQQCLQLAILGIGEEIRLAYLVGPGHRHEFRATVVGESTLALRLAMRDGGGNESLVWIPKNWELIPVPHRAGLWWFPRAKALEIGTGNLIRFT